LKAKLKSFSLEKNKITTYLLGITGVGKSTFTNYMLGANLTFKKKGVKYFLENGDDERFPKIGNKPSSCTEIPSIYEG
jgi:ribosome biogenesis GTPase A